MLVLLGKIKNNVPRKKLWETPTQKQVRNISQSFKRILWSAKILLNRWCIVGLTFSNRICSVNLWNWWLFAHHWWIALHPSCRCTNCLLFCPVGLQSVHFLNVLTPYNSLMQFLITCSPIYSIWICTDILLNPCVWRIAISKQRLRKRCVCIRHAIFFYDYLAHARSIFSIADWGKGHVTRIEQFQVVLALLSILLWWWGGVWGCWDLPLVYHMWMLNWNMRWRECDMRRELIFLCCSRQFVKCIVTLLTALTIKEQYKHCNIQCMVLPFLPLVWGTSSKRYSFWETQVTAVKWCLLLIKTYDSTCLFSLEIAVLTILWLSQYNLMIKIIAWQ